MKPHICITDNRRSGGLEIRNEPETGGIGVFSNIQCAMLKSVQQISILRGPGAVVEGITHTKPKTQQSQCYISALSLVPGPGRLTPDSSHALLVLLRGSSFPEGHYFLFFFLLLLSLDFTAPLSLRCRLFGPFVANPLFLLPF